MENKDLLLGVELAQSRMMSILDQDSDFSRIQLHGNRDTLHRSHFSLFVVERSHLTFAEAQEKHGSINSCSSWISLGKRE